MYKIFISKDDYNKLQDLIKGHAAQASLDTETRDYISALKEKLKIAQVVESWDIRLIDVVTMNSSVRFKNLVTGKEEEYLIVYPKLECKNLGRLSILSGLGVALLGHRKWEIVKVKKSNGSKYEVQILNIQPTPQEWIKRLEEQ